MSRPQASHLSKLVVKMLPLQRVPVLGKFFVVLVQALGVDFPPPVKYGKGLILAHCTSGLVVHYLTTIGDDVTLFQNVTIGRGDAYNITDPDGFPGVFIEDGAVICAGAAVLGFPGRPPVVIGKGAVIGANSVVTESVPAGELWAGAPARKVRDLLPVG